MGTIKAVNPTVKWKRFGAALSVALIDWREHETGETASSYPICATKRLIMSFALWKVTSSRQTKRAAQTALFIYNGDAGAEGALHVLPASSVKGLREPARLSEGSYVRQRILCNNKGRD